MHTTHAMGGYKKEVEVKIIVYWLVAAEYIQTYKSPTPEEANLIQMTTNPHPGGWWFALTGT